MPFVKLDCGMLDSTIWIDRVARDLFVTALLMAEPKELTHGVVQLKVRTLDETGFIIPPGWYGFVPAAGSGIIRRSGFDMEEGLSGLERLGAKDPESRTPDFEGRRLVRIDGGYLVLNYNKYRERDYTSAERSRRYREKKRNAVASTSHTVISQPVTQAEAEEEVYKKKREPSAKASAASNKVPIEAKEIILPEKFQTTRFCEIWSQWIAFRKKGKRSGNWRLFFKEELDKIRDLSEPQAFEAVKNAFKSGWQSLYQPKEIKKEVKRQTYEELMNENASTKP